MIILANAGDSWEIFSREDQRKPIGWRHNHDHNQDTANLYIRALLIFQEYFYKCDNKFGFQNPNWKKNN